MTSNNMDKIRDCKIFGKVIAFGIATNL